MTKDELLQCLRAISNIEGYVIKNGGISDDIIGEHFDYITEQLQNEIKNIL